MKSIIFPESMYAGYVTDTPFALIDPQRERHVRGHADNPSRFRSPERARGAIADGRYSSDSVIFQLNSVTGHWMLYV